MGSGAWGLGPQRLLRPGASEARGVRREAWGHSRPVRAPTCLPSGGAVALWRCGAVALAVALWRALWPAAVPVATSRSATALAASRVAACRRRRLEVLRSWVLGLGSWVLGLGSWGGLPPAAPPPGRPTYYGSIDHGSTYCGSTRYGQACSASLRSALALALSAARARAASSAEAARLRAGRARECARWQGGGGEAMGRGPGQRLLAGTGLSPLARAGRACWRRRGPFARRPPRPRPSSSRPRWI